MAQPEFFLRRLAPTAAIDRFLECAEAFWGAGRPIKVSLTDSLDSVTEISPDQRKMGVDEIRRSDELKKFRAQLAGVSALEVIRMEAAPIGDPTWPSIKYQIEGPSSPYAKITLEGERNQVRPKLHDALKAVASKFDLMPRAELLAQDLPQAAKERIATYDAAIEQLSAQTAKLGTFLAQSAQSAEESFLRRDREQQERIRKEEETARARTDAHSAKRKAELDHQAEELKKRSDALDVREHRAASRENLQKLVDQLQQDYKQGARAWSVTQGTLWKRVVVHVVCLVGLTLFGLLAGYSAWTALKVPLAEFHWRLFVPFSTGTLGFASTLIFYMRWTSRWFADHADREFMNVGLLADSMRGAWVVELLMAWHEQGQTGDFPPVLLDRLSRNLFNRDGRTGVDHPIADAAAATPKLFKKVDKRLAALTDAVKDASAKGVVA